MRKINHFHLPAVSRALVRFFFPLFVLLLALRLFLQNVPVRKAKAIEPNCMASWIGYEPDNEIFGLSVVKQDTGLHFIFTKNPTDVILDRYIYDGYNWQVVSPTYSSSYYDNTALIRKYFETKDFIVAGGWRYRNADGKIQTVTCNSPLTIAYREIINFGQKRLDYPIKTSDTQIIRGRYTYICGSRKDDDTNSWQGNNTHLPVAETAWKWDSLIPSFFGTSPYVVGQWQRSESFDAVIPYPNNFPSQNTLSLTAPSFNPEEGKGSYAIYNFNNLVVYSRDDKRNYANDPPPLPRYQLYQIKKPSPSQPPRLLGY